MAPRFAVAGPFPTTRPHQQQVGWVRSGGRERSGIGDLPWTSSSPKWGEGWCRVRRCPEPGRWSKDESMGRGRCSARCERWPRLVGCRAAMERFGDAGALGRRPGTGPSASASSAPMTRSLRADAMSARPEDELWAEPDAEVRPGAPAVKPHDNTADNTAPSHVAARSCGTSTPRCTRIDAQQVAVPDGRLFSVLAGSRTSEQGVPAIAMAFSIVSVDHRGGCGRTNLVGITDFILRPSHVVGLAMERA